MRRTDLALRALRLLETVQERKTSAELAESLKSTPQFLPQVMKPLVRDGWVSSEPGPRGGYRLATPLSGRTMLELIELIEGRTDDGQCVLVGGPCDGATRCAIHEAWSTARAALTDELGSIPVTRAFTGRE